MKIVAFAVWLECENCHGEKWVPGGQVQYGEVIPCPVCKGKGSVLGQSWWADFEKLIRGVAAKEPKR